MIIEHPGDLATNEVRILKDDARLIADVCIGDHEAFAQLVDRYQLATYALVMQRIGSAVVAEEITQDVFVAAYEKIHQLKEPTRFGAWLRVIALRECGMWQRRRKRNHKVRSLSETGSVPELRVPCIRSERHEDALGIDALIVELPERLRAAAVLCFQDGLSPSVAASVLGLKAGTLRKRLHDARAKLQRQIVEAAQKNRQMHLLPLDFAERCVCRCEKSRKAKSRKEVMNMAEKKNCGCGCMSESKRPAKTKDSKKKTRTKKEKK